MNQLPFIRLSESNKDTFLHMGITFFCAQSFEESLRGLLVGNFHLSNPKASKDSIKDYVDKIEDKTLGRLLNEVSDKIEIDDVDLEKLRNAIKKRNYFSHKFYYENFSLMTTSKGLKKVSEKLASLSKVFTEAQNIIAPLSFKMMLDYGWSEEEISQNSFNANYNQLREHGFDEK